MNWLKVTPLAENQDLKAEGLTPEHTTLLLQEVPGCGKALAKSLVSSTGPHQIHARTGHTCWLFINSTHFSLEWTSKAVALVTVVRHTHLALAHRSRCVCDHR